MLYRKEAMASKSQHCATIEESVTTDFGTDTTAPDLTSQKCDASFAFCVVQEDEKDQQERKLAKERAIMVSDPLRGSGILQGRPARTSLMPEPLSK